MAGSGVALNIVVLDACRNNPLRPLAFGGCRGLDSSDRLFVSFSSPAPEALDGDGRNSPYAKHLSVAIGTPGLRFSGNLVFKRTLKGVYKDTQGQQGSGLPRPTSTILFHAGDERPAVDQAQTETAASANGDLPVRRAES